MPVWTQERLVGPDGAPFALQFCDLALAQGWIDQVAQWVTPAEEARVDARPYAEQASRVLGIWRGIGYVYQALNCPPLSHPAYRDVLVRWNGQTYNVDRTQAAHDCVGAQFAGTGDADSGRVLLNDRDESGGVIVSRIDPAHGGIIYDRVVSRWRSLGRSTATVAGRPVVSTLPVRVTLAADPFRQCGLTPGQVMSMCEGPFGETLPGGIPNGLCNYGVLYVGRSDSDGRENETTPYNWNSLMWNDPPLQAYPVLRALPPLRWYFQMAREISAVLSRRGALYTLVAMRVGIATKNAETMVDAGVSDDAALVELAGARRATDDAMASPGAQRGLAAYAAVTALVNVVPVAGQIASAAMGALLGVATILAEVMPSAHIYRMDVFGRAEPVFEVSTIGGDETHPPRLDIPDPLGFDRAALAARAQQVPGGVAFVSPLVVPAPGASAATPLTADQALALLGLDCAGWRALTGAARDARIKAVAPALTPTARRATAAAIDARCAPGVTPGTPQPSSALGTLARLALLAGAGFGGYEIYARRKGKH